MKLHLFGLAALLFTACASPRQDKSDDANTITVRGVTIKYEEIARDGQFVLPPDSKTKGRTKRVGLQSKLRLTFAVPPAPEDVQDLGEWTELTAALATCQRLLKTCEVLNVRARDLVNRNSDPEFKAAVRAFNDETQNLEDYVVRTGFVDTADELYADGKYWENLGRAIDAQRKRLEKNAKEFAESSMEEVHIRAVLEPEVGPAQLLQVPGYYELSEEALESRPSSAQAQADKLRLEFEAAQQVSEMIHELKQDGPAVLEQTKTELREALERLGDDLEAFGAAWTAQIEGIVGNELAAENLTGSPAALRTNLETLLSDLATAQATVAKARAFVESLLEGHLVSLKTAFDRGAAIVGEVTSFLEHLETSWPPLFDEIEANLVGAANEFAADAVETTLGEVALTRFETPLQRLQERLPKTAGTINSLRAVFESGNQVLGVIGELDDSGTQVPRPKNDLTPTEINLKRNPVTDGDEIRVVLEFWEPNQSRKTGDIPLETVRYTTEIVQTGWIWSGDVIFTKPFQGDGDFIASAAVSREWRGYDRADPYSIYNRLDPRAGFHAAQLNRDSDQTLEIGVGLNGSLWGGLLRFGAGYNINADVDEEYWYFGFGLISALNQLGAIDIDGRSD